MVWGEGGRTVILLAHFVSSLPNPLASAQTLSPSTQLSAVVVVVIVLAVTVVVVVVAVVVGNILRWHCIFFSSLFPGSTSLKNSFDAMVIARTSAGYSLPFSPSFSSETKVQTLVFGALQL